MRKRGKNKGMESKDISRKSARKIILVGNPNVGKSVVFNYLTGKYVVVSNYPGTTVEVSHGTTKWRGKNITVLDTPGVNSLLPTSEDEIVTRNILLNEKDALIVQVADAKNLRRSLLISSQLAEMGSPFLLVLNMEDEARERGIKINYQELSSLTGAKAISTVATQKKNLEKITEELGDLREATLHISYPPALEEAISQIADFLPEENISPRSIAIMLLSGDKSLKRWLHARLPESRVNEIEAILRSCQAGFDQPISYLINQARLEKVDEIVRRVTMINPIKRKRLSTRIGELSVHPFWGTVILIGAVYLLYQAIGVFGAGVAVDFMEETVFGEYINPFFIRWTGRLVPVAWLRDLLVGQYGLLTMAMTYAFALILPIITFFFIAFGLMEDSGYLPRLAVMSNKIFRLIGLNGKAILPMILGLGCATMATLTTRILESKRDRIIVTLLLALGVPCSAQMAVIFGMLSGFSPMMIVLWAGVVGLVLAVVGYLAARYLPGESSDFVLELPPIRLPRIGNILIKTLSRIEWYLKEAVPLFALSTFILFIMDRAGILINIEKAAAPLIKGVLGLPVETTQAFLIGFLRRDYGAAGLLALARVHALSAEQILVAIVTLTLFVPCLANFLVIVKERGWKIGAALSGFILAVAFTVGGLLNLILKITGFKI
ncbi:MAG: ferrous iron transport protein B [Thermodesulfobacteriota bacterium]